MKSLHRIMVGGGFGVLAMATVASGAGFACSLQGRLTVDGSSSITVTPGSTVRVEARAFHSGHGSVRFNWNSVDGAPLGTLTSPTQAPNSDASVWIIDVLIPVSATPDQQAAYAIVGSQVNEGGELHATGSMQVWVKAPTPTQPGGQPDQPPIVSPIVSPIGSSPSGSSPSGSSPPNSPPMASPAASDTLSPPAAARTDSAAPRSTALTPEAAAINANTEPSNAIGPPSAPTTSSPALARAVDPTKPIPVPASHEIWSGLDSSAPSLLDASAPARHRSGPSAGGALLGLGLALTGAAAVIGRRGLAFAKTARR